MCVFVSIALIVKIGLINFILLIPAIIIVKLKLKYDTSYIYDAIDINLQISVNNDKHDNLIIRRFLLVELKVLALRLRSLLCGFL